MKRTFVFYIVIFTFLFLFFHFGIAAEPPRAYFQTATKDIAAGAEFEVRVLIDSKEPINAFDFQIQYSTDTLELLKIDSQQSLVDVWAINQEETSLGFFVAGGGMTIPFNGSGGEIIRLHFRAKNNSVSSSSPAHLVRANINFVKADVYYADGAGTLAKATTQSLFIGHGMAGIGSIIRKVHFSTLVLIIVFVLVSAFLAAVVFIP